MKLSSGIQGTLTLRWLLQHFKMKLRTRMPFSKKDFKNSFQSFKFTLWTKTPFSKRYLDNLNIVCCLFNSILIIVIIINIEKQKSTNIFCHIKPSERPFWAVCPLVYQGARAWPYSGGEIPSITNLYLYFQS